MFITKNRLCKDFSKNMSWDKNNSLLKSFMLNLDLQKYKSTTYDDYCDSLCWILKGGMHRDSLKPIVYYIQSGRLKIHV